MSVPGVASYAMASLTAPGRARHVPSIRISSWSNTASWPPYRMKQCSYAYTTESAPKSCFRGLEPLTVLLMYESSALMSMAVLRITSIQPNCDRLRASHFLQWLATFSVVSLPPVIKVICTAALSNRGGIMSASSLMTDGPVVIAAGAVVTVLFLILIAIQVRCHLLCVLRNKAAVL